MRVFEITPKRITRTNNTVLTPEMKETVTAKQHVANPFYNGAEEVKYYQKACCTQSNYTFQALA